MVTVRKDVWYRDVHLFDTQYPKIKGRRRRKPTHMPPQNRFQWYMALDPFVKSYMGDKQHLEAWVERLVEQFKLDESRAMDCFAWKQLDPSLQRDITKPNASTSVILYSRNGESSRGLATRLQPPLPAISSTTRQFPGLSCKQ